MAAGVAHHIQCADGDPGRAELARSTVEDPVRSAQVVQQAARNAARLIRRMQELTRAPSARGPLVDLSERPPGGGADPGPVEGSRRERDINIEVSTEAGRVPAVTGDPAS